MIAADGESCFSYFWLCSQAASRAARRHPPRHRPEVGLAARERDVITDFTHLGDDIDLMGIDADTTIAGNQAFTFVGNAALTGAGQVGRTTSGGNTIVRFSTDADAASEGEIQINGITTLTFEDFYL
jgi:hypothetical protein